MKKVKIGVVGAHRGFSIVNGAWNIKNAELTAICDLRGDRLDAALRALDEQGTKGVKTYKSYEEMLRSDIDAVIVATDAPLHARHAIMAINAGKHTLSEIPTVYTVEEVGMIRAALEAHPEVKYMTGENCCFWDHITAWRRMREDGKFGRIVYAEGEYLHCEKTPEEFEPYDDPSYWRANLPAIRYLIHSLGPLLYVMDDRVTRVSCYVPDFNQNPYKSERDVGIALFQTERGAVIRIFICFGAYVGYNHSYALYGSEGMIVSDPTKEFGESHSFARLSEIPSSASGMIEIPVGISSSRTKEGHGGADVKMLTEFVSAIVEDRAPILDFEYGVNISLPGIIAEQSYKNGNAALDIPRV